jgi:hypothetical protein
MARKRMCTLVWISALVLTGLALAHRVAASPGRESSLPALQTGSAPLSVPSSMATHDAAVTWWKAVASYHG